MRRAAKTARKVARMPVYLWKNGKVVADLNAVSSPLLSSQSRTAQRNGFTASRKANSLYSRRRPLTLPRRCQSLRQ
jgi:hypothetical protein